MHPAVVLTIAAALGLIPAKIAKDKGHSFGLWWFYGWMLFVVAIVHVQFIEDYIKQPEKQDKLQNFNNGSKADELIKYKQLFDDGAITEEEYKKKKEELLN